MIKRFIPALLLIGSIPIITSFAAADTRKKLLIHTSFGDIKLVLYDETPKHRDNFLKLAENHTLDSTLFHRVIKDFMIQGGDPDSRKAMPGQFLGNGDVGYTIPAEFHPNLYHKKGALAAARQSDDVNPLKASSGCQFYIVQGKKYREGELDTLQKFRMDQPVKQGLANTILNEPENAALRASFIRAQMRFNTTGNSDSLNYYSALLEPKIEERFKNTPHRIITPEQREAYKTAGGTPFLDGGYTVFGEVISGLEVVDAIASQPVDANKRPIINGSMTIKIYSETGEQEPQPKKGKKKNK
jgi:cyclophilin family peptidyl-prolyl cis-trans isomerase